MMFCIFVHSFLFSHFSWGLVGLRSFNTLYEISPSSVHDASFGHICPVALNAMNCIMHSMSKMFAKEEVILGST